MKKIVYVFNSTPILGGFQAELPVFHQKMYFDKLKEVIEPYSKEYFLQLDETMGDIDEIFQSGADGVICIPGLQFKTISNKDEQKNMFFIESSDYYHQDTEKVMEFIKNI